MHPKLGHRLINLAEMMFHQHMLSKTLLCVSYAHALRISGQPDISIHHPLHDTDAKYKYGTVRMVAHNLLVQHTNHMDVYAQRHRES